MKFTINIIMLCVLLHAGCKPVQVTRQEKLLSMPEQYSAQTPQGEGMARLNWREFFSDTRLADLIDTTLANNLDLQIALRRVQQSQSAVLAAKGSLKPYVEAAAAAGITRFGLYTMDGAGNRGTEIYKGNDVPEHLPDFFIGLQAGWEIDLWGKLRNKKKAAVARFLAGVEGRNLVQTGVVAAVAEAYFSLQSLDVKLEILDEYIGLQQNALDIVQVQKEAGTGNELAVKQFEAQLIGLRAMRLEVLQEIVETESAVNALAGRYPQPIARSAAMMDQRLPPLAETGVPPQLLDNRPDIRAAALELQASKADLNAARAAFYPSFNIGAVLGMQAFRPDLLVTSPQSLAYGLLGNVAAPLLNKRAIRAEFNFADAYQFEALLNYQQSILNAYIEVYNQLNIQRNLEQVFDLKNRQSEALGSAVSVSDELFRTGRASYLEVLAAQQNALDTRLETVDLRKRQWQTAVGLYRALGGGWR